MEWNFYMAWPSCFIIRRIFIWVSAALFGTCSAWRVRARCSLLCMSCFASWFLLQTCLTTRTKCVRWNFAAACSKGYNRTNEFKHASDRKAHFHRNTRSKAFRWCNENCPKITLPKANKQNRNQSLQLTLPMIWLSLWAFRVTLIEMLHSISSV